MCCSTPPVLLACWGFQGGLVATAGFASESPSESPGRDMGSSGIVFCVFPQVVDCLLISVGARATLCRWRELLPKTADDGARSQLEGQTVGEWCSRHVQFAITFMQLFWALCSMGSVFNTLAGSAAASGSLAPRCPQLLAPLWREGCSEEEEEEPAGPPC
ncbi:unnamed protein product [Prorocentrum cordatum]|uniref:Solute carrier family 40 protein n=1 Tax=Prorocentrum cordatum TaxID=2364126 RepID=A0ABN9SRV3_9DINO|nr:unnamed protein product [Polarella glacialis]